MKLTARTVHRVIGGVALLCGAALLPGTALATTAPSAKASGHASSHASSRAWGAPRCTERQTEIWLGLGNGGGTAGTIFYPLEFTNISHHTCTLWGYPQVKALSSGGRQIGKASRALRSRHWVVTLWPGWTAHAALGIVEAGNVCSRPVNAATLKIRAPHQGSSTQISLPFQACRGKRVLVTGPVTAGVGIP
jgi:hypothetical protein